MKNYSYLNFDYYLIIMALYEQIFSKVIIINYFIHFFFNFIFYLLNDLKYCHVKINPPFCFPFFYLYSNVNHIILDLFHYPHILHLLDYI